MVKLIIKKELRDIIGSSKFVISYLICSVLILTTFVFAARKHHIFQSHYEASVVENLRKMEGITDWQQLDNHRIFLPPSPLESLVTGISSSIGRAIETTTSGDLKPYGSRFNEEPLFALFGILDLNFIFNIVLSLFAIMFGFDAINGEKELGTLRLTFSNPVPKDVYVLGKLIGSFVAIVVPIMVPLGLGCLILPFLGISLSGSEWFQLMLIILSGMLYFAVFLTLSLFASVLVKRSTHSLLILLIIWISSAFIIPKTAVALAGRAIDVPTVAELDFEKSQYQSQLWNEDKAKLSDFKVQEPENTEPSKMVEEFNKFMQSLADERHAKMETLSRKLREKRRNMLSQQSKLALWLARISPTTLFTIISTRLAGTSLEYKESFLDESRRYQEEYARFIREKTGMNMPGMTMIVIKQGETQKDEPIDPHELPQFSYTSPDLNYRIQKILPDIGLLSLFELMFFIGTIFQFLRYDVR